MKDHLYSKKKLLGEDSPFSELLQGMVNGILEGEMDNFLSEERMKNKPNKRNGKLAKRVITGSGSMYIETPRDRNRDFEHQLVAKRQIELSSGLDD